eukprot:COSAG01_NODE_1280_length_10925_cov_23.969333_4_plen_56_part_00
MLSGHVKEWVLRERATENKFTRHALQVRTGMHTAPFLPSFGLCMPAAHVGAANNR